MEKIILLLRILGRPILWSTFILQLVLLNFVQAAPLGANGLSEATAISLLAEIEVSGTVFDEIGGPMPGVSILIKGSSSGAVTDINGQFELSNVPEDGVLVFSFLGYESQAVSVNDQTVITVNMVPDTHSLEVAVAVG